MEVDAIAESLLRSLDSGGMCEPISDEIPDLSVDAAYAVLAAIGPRPIHVDEACERAGLPLPAVTGALLTLTLQAVVVEGPAGFFRRAAVP